MNFRSSFFSCCCYLEVLVYQRTSRPWHQELFLVLREESHAILAPIKRCCRYDFSWSQSVTTIRWSISYNTIPRCKVSLSTALTYLSRFLACLRTPNVDSLIRFFMHFPNLGYPADFLYPRVSRGFDLRYKYSRFHNLLIIWEGLKQREILPINYLWKPRSNNHKSKDQWFLEFLWRFFRTVCIVNNIQQQFYFLILLALFMMLST